MMSHGFQPLMVFAHRARVTAYAEEIKQQMEEQ